MIRLDLSYLKNNAITPASNQPSMSSEFYQGLICQTGYVNAWIEQHDDQEVHLICVDVYHLAHYSNLVNSDKDGVVTSCPVAYDEKETIYVTVETFLKWLNYTLMSFHNAF